jgi:hypothetical protein
VKAVGVSTNGVNDVGKPLRLVLIGATDLRWWISSDVLDRCRCIGGGSWDVDVECLGRGIDDRLEVEPEPGFKGVVDEADVEVDGPAAAAASSLTIRFLPVSLSSSQSTKRVREKD